MSSLKPTSIQYTTQCSSDWHFIICIQVVH